MIHHSTVIWLSTFRPSLKDEIWCSCDALNHVLISTMRGNIWKTTQTLSGSVWKFAYGASDSVSGRHRWVRARDRVNEWLTPLVDFIIILAWFIIINQRRVISKISKSFVSALVGLGSFCDPRRLSTVSYATLAWRVVVETMVHDAVEKWKSMGKNQKSAFENFFLTDENDG